jgi:hypothetical protein
MPIGKDPIVGSAPPGEPPRRTTRRELDIQDYLEATADAAARSRNVTITMVVACALVFVAVVNSLQNSWMLQRIQASNSSQSSYVTSKIALPPNANLKARPLGALDPDYPERYKIFYGALWKSYVDNSYYIRVPFFGFALDANDIGVFAGIAFCIIALMMRFALAREIENLRASFRRVTNMHDLYEFYTLLSMRQVFTVPETELVKRSAFSWLAPKAVWLAPVCIEALVALHDYQTNVVGQEIDDIHTLVILWSNALLVGLVLLFCFSVIRRMFVMDRLWDNCWAALQNAHVADTVRRPRVTFLQSPSRWILQERARRAAKQRGAAG